MGPNIDMNNTAEKEKQFLACVYDVYIKRRSYYRGIKKLKDERIICYDYLEKEKNYLNISIKNLFLILYFNLKKMEEHHYMKLKKIYY